MTMSNPMQLIQMLYQIKQNPMQMLSQRFNLSANLPSNPQDIIQHLLNTNQVTQAQVNQAMQLRNSPMITRIFGRN